MSLLDESVKPVHYPQDPDKFEFDGEVSRIFPDMARRSIPMYDEVHRLHVSLIREVLDREEVTMWDIGASHGQFFQEVCNQFQIPLRTGRDGWHFVAVDNSHDMLLHLLDRMPWVDTVECDAQQLPEMFPDMEGRVDVISMFYVLQFIKETKDQRRILEWARKALRPGGYLLLGQKHKVSAPFDVALTREYINFRQRNGYTMEEIEAKTRALRNSMWPIRREWLEDLCVRAGFEYVETTRWLQFSTSMCRVPL